MGENKILQGDCLEVMEQIPDKSIDLVLTDPPYGITSIVWDRPVDLVKLWNVLKRIGKDNCAYLFTCSQPFTTDLIVSNRKWFKYEWIWLKNKYFAPTRNQPQRATESILVFYKKPPIFNEIPIKRTKKEYKMCYRKNDSLGIGTVHRPAFRNFLKRKSAEEQWYRRPINLLEIKTYDKRNRLRHPTQKPIELMEYMIKTYTNKGDVVLDPFLGSGTTAVACQLLGRKYITIEINPDYIKIAKERLAQRVLI